MRVHRSCASSLPRGGLAVTICSQPKRLVTQESAVDSESLQLGVVARAVAAGFAVSMLQDNLTYAAPKKRARSAPPARPTPSDDDGQPAERAADGSKTLDGEFEQLPDGYNY